MKDLIGINKIKRLWGVTFGRKYISKDKFWYLFDKQKGKCKKCKKKFSSTVRPHIDHKKPISRGGAKTKLSNLQLLCAKCNLEKGNKIRGKGTRKPQSKLPAYLRQTQRW